MTSPTNRNREFIPTFPYMTVPSSVRGRSQTSSGKKMPDSSLKVGSQTLGKGSPLPGRVRKSRDVIKNVFEKEDLNSESEQALKGSQSKFVARRFLKRSSSDHFRQIPRQAVKKKSAIQKALFSNNNYKIAAELYDLFLEKYNRYLQVKKLPNLEKGKNFSKHCDESIFHYALFKSNIAHQKLTKELKKIAAQNAWCQIKEESGALLKGVLRCLNVLRHVLSQHIEDQKKKVSPFVADLNDQLKNFLVIRISATSDKERVKMRGSLDYFLQALADIPNNEVKEFLSCVIGKRVLLKLEEYKGDEPSKSFCARFKHLLWISYYLATIKNEPLVNESKSLAKRLKKISLEEIVAKFTPDDDGSIGFKKIIFCSENRKNIAIMPNFKRKPFSNRSKKFYAILPSDKKASGVLYALISLLNKIDLHSSSNIKECETIDEEKISGSSLAFLKAASFDIFSFKTRFCKENPGIFKDLWENYKGRYGKNMFSANIENSNDLPLLQVRLDGEKLIIDQILPIKISFNKESISDKIICAMEGKFIGRIIYNKDTEKFSFETRLKFSKKSFSDLKKLSSTKKISRLCKLIAVLGYREIEFLKNDEKYNKMLERLALIRKPSRQESDLKIHLDESKGKEKEEKKIGFLLLTPRKLFKQQV